jgi:hypothetical protein
MAKTELGCQILQEKGHFSEFSQFIRKHSQESEDTDLIMKLKSILWAVVRLLILVVSGSILTSNRVMSVQQKGACPSLRRKKLFQPS